MTALIIGHRGAPAYLPENTLEAFDVTFNEFKADIIELDVHYSLDHIPVIIHDANLERTTNGNGCVAQKFYTDLQRLDAGYLFDPTQKGIFPYRNKGIKIPTLQNVLERFNDKRLAIHVKQKSTVLVHTIIKLLKQYGNLNRTIIGSEHDIVSQTIRNTYPRVARFCSKKEIWSLLMKRLLPSGSPQKDTQAVVSTPIRSSIFQFGNRNWIEYLHRNNMRAFFWTINDPKVMQHLRDCGADGIITDDPKLARRTLD